MQINNQNKVINFYNKRFKKYGDDIKSVGWGDIESQELRFKILAEIDKLDNSSILDLGCGFGDLYDFFSRNKIKIDYRGIDINEELLKIARSKYPKAEFQCLNILNSLPSKKYDYVLSSCVSVEKRNPSQNSSCQAC